MNKEKQINFRVSQEMYDKCATYCRRMKDDFGIELNISDVVRSAVNKLDISDYEKFMLILKTNN